MDFLLNSYQFLNCHKAIQRKALNPPAFSALLMIPVYRISASVQKSKREPLCGGSRFCESYQVNAAVFCLWRICAYFAGDQRAF